MMINRFLVLLVVLAVFVQPAAAFAQNCDVQAEAIVKLRAPSFGAYNVWDSVYGEVETHEQFKSGFVLPTKNLFVAGEHIDPDKGDKKSLLLSEIGRNGRVLWEKQHGVSNLLNIMKMVPHPKGAMIMANIMPSKGRSYIWLGIVNTAGELLSHKTIKGGKADLKGYDLVEAASGKSYVVAAYSEVQGSGQAGSSVLYRVNSKGVVFSDQAFVIGSENALQDIHVMDNGDYMGVGYVYDSYGRKAGWMMRMNNDLQMIWQQSYSRGAAAEFAAGYSMLSGTFVAVGTALPAREGNRAGWVAVVDASSGTVGWQRYFTEGLHLEGRDVMTRKDGIISVLLDGKKDAEAEGAEHIRLLTLNPRGVLFSGDAYFNGEAVDVYQVMPGAYSERLIVGTTRLAHQIEAEQTENDKGEKMETGVTRSYEGWVVAAQSADVYADPCKVQVRELR